MLPVTPQERLALGVTVLLLAAGAGARILGSDPPSTLWLQNAQPAADTRFDDPRATRLAAEKALAREKVRAEPLADGERIDPNRATADQIDRLPRIGPALAARIVEWREAHGPFRSLAELDSVPGVGPALLAEVAPHLHLPKPPAAARPAPKSAVLDVNRASVAELDALPGIGPVLARRVVEWRDEKGAFRSLEELERVPGIGPALLRKLSGSLRVGP